MKVCMCLLVSVVLSLFSLWLHLADAQQSPPEVLPAGVSQKPVLEGSLGAPSPVGWKWQIQERTRPKAGDVTRHTNSALYYTLEGTHELVRGETVQSFLGGQAVFIPAGVEHIHRMLPIGSNLRTFEIYFARGDAAPPDRGRDPASPLLRQGAGPKTRSDLHDSSRRGYFTSWSAARTNPKPTSHQLRPGRYPYPSRGRPGVQA